MTPHVKVKVRVRLRARVRVGARARARVGARVRVGAGVRVRVVAIACDDAVGHGTLSALEIDLAHLALARGVVRDDALGGGVGTEHVRALEEAEGDPPRVDLGGGTGFGFG